MAKSPRKRMKGLIQPFVKARSFGTNLISHEEYLFPREPAYGTPFDGANVGQNSIMLDYVSDLYEFGDHPVQSCDQVKVTKSFGASSLRIPHYRFPYKGFTDFEFTSDGAFLQGSDYLDFEQVYPSPPASVLQRHATNFMSEATMQFPTEISLANTLLELKDIPQLVKFLRDWHVFLDNILTNPRAASVQDVSDLWIGYHFGASPVIGDIIKIANLLQMVLDRLEHLRRTRNKFTRVGTLTRYSESRDTLVGRFITQLGEEVKLDLIQSDYEIRSTAKVRNILTWLDSWQGIVRGLIGTAGLDNPASIIWNAIPWSWAVDGIFPIGDFFETMKFQDLTGWVVKQLCTSIKGKHTIRVSVKPWGGVFLSQGTFEVTRYSRSVGIPPLLGAISNPNLMQVSLFAAAISGRNG